MLKSDQQEMYEGGNSFYETEAQVNSAESEEDDKMGHGESEGQRGNIVSFEEITAAAYRIRSSLLDTPCTRSRMSEQLGATVWFKKEFMQYTGSFKERGVRYALLALDQATKKQGVVAASAGSYAYALAYHGDQLRIPIVLFMPTYAPLMHIQFCTQHHAKVFVKGNTLQETTIMARKYSRENQIRFLNIRCDRQIAIGNATVGLDIIKDVSHVDAVILPVGDGTLVACTALAIKNHNPQIEVIACRHSTSDSSMDRSHSADNQMVTSSRTHVNTLVDKVITTKEEENVTAIIWLIEMEKCMVEQEAASGLAALLGNRLPDLRGKRVVVLLTGGNTDTTKVERIIERGLVAAGRLHHFSLVISDHPGGLRELCNMVADLGVSVKDIFHERRFLTDINSVQVRCVVETRDAAHAEELKSSLRKRYGQVDCEIEDTTYGVDLSHIYDFS